MSENRQIIFITGASSGIGASLALEYGRRGASVVLCARRKDKLEERAERIRSSGGQALAVECDVRSRSSVDSAVQQALEKFGRLDVVVANAGFGVYGEVEALTEEDFRRQFETNVFGVLHTVQATIPELKRTRGRLAIVGSVYSYLTNPLVAPYTMSKYAVRALGETLDFELRPQGVSVTMIYPGIIGTEFRKVTSTGLLKSDTSEPLPSFLVMPSDVAARKIRRAIDGRRRTLTLTFMGKFGKFMKNYLPCLYNSMMHAFRGQVRKFVRKIES